MLTGKPSTKQHIVLLEYPGARFSYIVHAGSRTSCNEFWLALPAKERQHHKVMLASAVK